MRNNSVKTKTNSGCLRNFDIEASSLVTSLVWLTAVVSRASTVFIPMSNQDNHTEHQLFNKVSQERSDWHHIISNIIQKYKKEPTVLIAAVSPENIHNTSFSNQQWKKKQSNLFNWANFEIKKTSTIFTIDNYIQYIIHYWSSLCHTLLKVKQIYLKPKSMSNLTDFIQLHQQEYRYVSHMSASSVMNFLIQLTLYC